MAVRVVRVKLQGPFELCRRRIHAPLSRQYGAEAALNAGIPRHELCGLLQVRKRFVGTARAGEGDREVRLRLAIPGVHLQCSRAVGECVSMPPFAQSQSAAEATLCKRVAGIQPQRLLEIRDRIIKLAPARLDAT